MSRSMKVPKIDYDKLAKENVAHCKRVADALEIMIVKSRLSDEELANQRDILDRTREHIGGWEGPIWFSTEQEARRYVCEQNLTIGANSKKECYRMEKNDTGWYVHHPLNS